MSNPPNPYRVSFNCLDSLQQAQAFYQYQVDTKDICLFKEFIKCVADYIDWDSRTGQEWNKK